jgi:UDP-N-acetylmuramoyl-tripeptide--D-alanyl-D-alanine ligase
MVKPSLFEFRLRRLTKKYLTKFSNIRVIIVSGTTGKLATKSSIASVMSEQYRVRMRYENETSAVGSMLSIIGVNHPDDIAIDKHLKHELLKAAKDRIKEKFSDADFIVLDIPANHPGDVRAFSDLIRPIIAVITSVSPRHVGAFQTLEMVAQEQMEAANMSEFAIINRDDIEPKYAQYLTNPNLVTYGVSGESEYHFIEQDYSTANGYKGQFVIPGVTNPIQASVNLLGEDNIRAAVAAVAVGYELGVSIEYIVSGIDRLRPLNGQMKTLRGVNESVIIDDSLRANAIETKNAIRLLYQVSSPQRILVLGSIPDLGTYSEVIHQEIGYMCDPDQLSWVILIGKEAALYIAPVAKKKGCQVKVFENSIEAGAFVHQIIDRDAVVLFNGSSNTMLEEAIKIVLLDTTDEINLVRQDSAWLKYKNKLFSKYK